LAFRRDRCSASRRRGKAATIGYRNAAGQSWDGQGEMPDWLRRAANAGQSVEFYRVG